MSQRRRRCGTGVNGATLTLPPGRVPPSPAMRERGAPQILSNPGEQRRLVERRRCAADDAVDAVRGGLDDQPGAGAEAQGADRLAVAAAAGDRLAELTAQGGAGAVGIRDGAAEGGAGIDAEQAMDSLGFGGREQRGTAIRVRAAQQ